MFSPASLHVAQSDTTGAGAVTHAGAGHGGVTGRQQRGFGRQQRMRGH